VDRSKSGDNLREKYIHRKETKKIEDLSEKKLPFRLTKKKQKGDQKSQQQE
jgi:hypothetical protein